MSHCIFCDIVRGKLQHHLIYEDDNHIAILDKYPIDLGHSLVIPKKPYEKLTDMNSTEIAELFIKIPKIIISEKLILKVPAAYKPPNAKSVFNPSV